MRCVPILVCLLGGISLATALRIIPRSQKPDATPEGFLKAGPGGIDAIEITPKNLLAGTSGNPKAPVLKHRAPDSASLMVKLINNLDRATVRAYISGLDATGKVFFLSPTLHVSSEITEDITLSLGSKNQTLDVSLPPFIRSGRVYFADSDLRFFVVNNGGGDSVVQPSVTNLRDPNADVNWGFVELTYMNGLLYANISYVDFVGIVLGMMLTEKDGSTQTTAGLVADAVTKICNDLMKLREADHRDWASLCIANAEGKTVRVLSPGNRHEVEAQLFNDYWDTYVNEVWKKYATQDLVIDTQSNASQVKCRVSDNQLVCEGSDRGFAKPTSKDIWGCNSGPYSPRICAAFVRSTLLLDGGDIQPSLGQGSYYTVNPTNHYSRIVHSYEVDGRGYAFPYDDVNPDGNEDASGVVSSNNVQSLAIYVGAPPSLG
ncbi:hypothetical protein NOF04DRAFT_1350725 [Fusarium oxysporum II5]|nr:hypothetical protein NOF04DRAFT_1350725 [Fusarium oxysporum II5]